jgi:AcrR family transcriptional regulator
MATDKLQLRWVKPPRQDRSRDMQERFVVAAATLMKRGKSWDEITINDLVKAANASVGAFYARFKDKAGLLRVMQHELAEQGAFTMAETAQVLAGTKASVEAMVKAFVELAVNSYHDQLGLRRATILFGAHDREVRARSVAMSRETCAALVQLLAERFPLAEVTRLRDTVDVAHRIVFGVLDQVAIAAGGSPTGHELADDALAEELAVAVRAYVEARLGVKAKR